MNWVKLKADLLEIGTVQLTGEPADTYIARSTAGPGAGGNGSLFFAVGNNRVKLGIGSSSQITIHHLGNGLARLIIQGNEIEGRLEEPGYHCPRQAFITVSSSCIYQCRFCEVPNQKEQRRKTLSEIVSMIEKKKDLVDVISLSSGVAESVDEEETYVISVVEELRKFNMPIGVSIYPTLQTPVRLFEAGVEEVKFNIETATPELFEEMCPGLTQQAIFQVLERSVELFGKNHVFSNVIIGLGETDEEMEDCIRSLTKRGIIPVLRPVNPVAELRHLTRPSAERLLKLHAFLSRALEESGLDPKEAKTMCVACRGCDLVSGYDT
jgi:biotin synthase-related radical SAM superfamily protein